MKKLILAILIILCFSSCSAQKKQSIDILTYFDTHINITAYVSDDDFEEIIKICNSLLKKYDQLFDIYDDYEINNIKTINDNSGKKAVKVDKEIINILKFAKEQYKLTDGHMNVAMGAVLSLWHDYRDNVIKPNTIDLEQASIHTNIDDVIIDEENSTVYLKDEKMSLDLGAIAKGYTADVISQELIKGGFTSVLINMGGNIIATGEKPDGSKWNVGIQNYDVNSENQVIDSVEIGNSSVVTSGDYQRFYEIDGKKYHHIIDKDTLYPAEYFHSVTVVSQSSAIADSLSTALFCMSKEEGEEVLQNYSGVKVIIK